MNFDDGSPVPCVMEEVCFNSPRNAGQEHTKCHTCSLSPIYTNEANPDLWRSPPSHWKPIGNWTKHPVLEARKVEARKARKEEARSKRLSKDKARQKRAIQATRAEARTNRSIIKATKNSGRSNRDGDHVAGGRITLDTKLQSKRLHPVVNLVELSKVSRQARAAGMLLGGLVLRGKTDVGIVALYEEDFGRLIRMLNLTEDGEKNEDQPGN
jgi:hypothetical protein